MVKRSMFLSFCIGIGSDEPVFADGKVISFGQIIGVVLAHNQPLAQRAAKAVKVSYEDIEPSIITIEVSEGMLTLYVNCLARC